MIQDEALKVTNQWEMEGFCFGGGVSQSEMRNHTEPPDDVPDNDCPHCGAWDTTTLLWNKGEGKTTVYRAIYYCPECEQYWFDESAPDNLGAL